MLMDDGGLNIFVREIEKARRRFKKIY